MDQNEVDNASELHPDAHTDTHKMEFERETFFHCCSGGVCDKRMLQFIATFFITTVVALFSMVQLYLVDKCDSDIYITLLTMCVSIWLPAPQLTENKM